jgi:CDGSH-type Zn-finger protein
MLRSTGENEVLVGSCRERRTVAGETKITALDNGPYLVKWPMKVLDAEGNEFRVERTTVALCRCGGSTTKPFCDGTHSKTGFEAAQRAVRGNGGEETS